MPTQPNPVPRPAKRRRLRPIVALCVLGTCLALAACGSSGSGSTSASTTSSTSSSKAAGGASRFASLRSCMKEQGITLPAPPAGTTGRPGGPGAGAAGGPGAGAAGGGPRGLQPPKGVSQSQFQAALKKCGAGNFGGKAGGVNSASARAALTKYAACLRENGVNVPEPNTSGNGPVFNTKGIDTSSSTFKAAQSKCQSDLKGAFPGGGPGGGAAGGGPGGGAPPSGGGA